jgi:hypothetical protein
MPSKRSQVGKCEVECCGKTGRREVFGMMCAKHFKEMKAIIRNAHRILDRKQQPQERSMTRYKVLRPV